MISKVMVRTGCCRWPLRVAAMVALGCSSAAAQEMPPETPRRLKGMAEQFERDGHKKEAAEVYERLVVKEPSSRGVIAPHLVKLYIETRQPKQALAWAREYMEDTPDPQAYLAGVYSQIGGYNEAMSILNKEIASAEKQGARALALRWQLADLQKKTGEIEAARKTLAEAVALAGDRPEGAVAKRQFETFEKAHPAPAADVVPAADEP